MPFAALALFGCVLYFPMPQRKVSRQDFAVEIEAVRMVDAAVKTVTDTPLDHEFPNVAEAKKEMKDDPHMQQLRACHECERR